MLSLEIGSLYKIFNTYPEYNCVDIGKLYHYDSGVSIVELFDYDECKDREYYCMALTKEPQELMFTDLGNGKGPFFKMLCGNQIVYVALYDGWNEFVKIS